MAIILVTGGAGYVGAHACKCLAAAGHDPVVFDNLGTGWRDAVRFGPLIEGDLLDTAALDAAFAEAKPQAVIHFAALSNVGESAGKPDLYWRNNVAGSLNLLTAMQAHRVGRIVFSSTCATYGEARGDVLVEEDAQAPINCYGRTKLAVERMLGDFEAAFGLRHVIFRYFNAAGASPDREIGEHHAPETHLIPLALDAVSGRRGALTIFGTDYPTPDGTCIRDYVHVMDLADAHLRGVDWLLAGGESLALNLGSGAGFSVREVIDTAARVTGAPCPHVEGARRPGDPPRLVSGSQRAAEVLGWQPQHSDLGEILADAWAWHQTGKYAR
ncbi:MAG: UDP-glucose 4-epimerase GalE [Pseudomonadota bacterium]